MGSDCNDTSIISLGFSKPNGSFALAYWNNTDIMYTTFESTVSYSVSRLPDDIKIIDPMSGDLKFEVFASIKNTSPILR